MGVRAVLLTAGLQWSLRLPWAIARPGRRRSTAACSCLPHTMPLTLRPSISRISSRSKYLLSNKMIRFFLRPHGVGYGILSAG